MTDARTMRLIAGVLALCSAGGCAASDPDDTDHLAVLAVRADPPTGTPGAAVSLELVHSGELLPSVRPDFEIVWLSCDDPPADVHYECFPELRERVRLLPQRVALASAGQLVRAHAGVGTRFELTLPGSLPADGYGTSFAFFAVCAGTLRPAPELADTVPLRCIDAAGANIGREGFAVGFTTVPRFAAPLNANPVITGLFLDGEPFENVTCGSDGDCPALGDVTQRCLVPGPGAPLSCVPEIDLCTDVRCSEHELEAELDPASAEPNPLAVPEGEAPPREILELHLASAWLDRELSTRGTGTGWLDPTSFELVGPPTSAAAEGTPLTLLVIARDNRGGVSWVWRHLVAGAPR